MREFLKQFLLYSRAERRAVVTLVLLIVIVLIVPRAYRFYAVKPVISFSDSSVTKDMAGIRNDDSDAPALRDPDTGRVEHTLSIHSRKKGASSSYIIEINTADSAAFAALYGIGPRLSARIVKFRKLLGGFYKVDQIAETYGLRDSTYQSIRPHLTVNPALVQKMDVNTTEYDELRRHPYIHARIAHAIISYRNSNGKYESLEQLKKLKPVTDEVYDKIQPYLKIAK